MPDVRVRFAPSPTGFLHVGGARTALFNWLFARNHGGKFILRIEDTDEVRSTQESVGAILSGMTWLGLDWDEGPDPSGEGEKGPFGPYSQMSRQDLYRNYAHDLVSQGKAYPCFCSPQELESMRTKALLAKQNPGYDGRCRDLKDARRKELESQGRKPVIRLKTPVEGATRFEDIVRGPVTFDNALQDDFVLLKASGVPTYNFAVVVDDYLMKISHAIRGDDHLSNTPKQLLLYDALGWGDFAKGLKWAHLSMILGPDGSRLSKRHGATSVEEYRSLGYLPEALLNYLALLGWSTEDSQQLFGKDELIKKFSLERCGKSAATFDPQKVLWMNGEYIRQADPVRLAELAMPYLKEAGLSGDKKLAAQCVKLEQEKFKLLTDVPKRLDFLLSDKYAIDQAAVDKAFGKPGVPDLLKGLMEKLRNAPSFASAGLEKLFRDYAAEKAVKTSPLFHSARAATSGRMEGPSLFHYLELLGKEKTLARMESALKDAANKPRAAP